MQYLLRDARKLQKALNKKGLKKRLYEDGIFGKATVLAIKKFQRDHRLIVDGVAGPDTLKPLGINKI